jgi:hypothetical protein
VIVEVLTRRLTEPLMMSWASHCPVMNYASRIKCHSSLPHKTATNTSLEFKARLRMGVTTTESRCLWPGFEQCCWTMVLSYPRFRTADESNFLLLYLFTMTAVVVMRTSNVIQLSAENELLGPTVSLVLLVSLSAECYQSIVFWIIPKLVTWSASTGSAKTRSAG